MRKQIQVREKLPHPLGLTYYRKVLHLVAVIRVMPGSAKNKDSDRKDRTDRRESKAARESAKHTKVAKEPVVDAVG